MYTLIRRTTSIKEKPYRSSTSTCVLKTVSHVKLVSRKSDAITWELVNILKENFPSIFSKLRDYGFSSTMTTVLVVHCTVLVVHYGFSSTMAIDFLLVCIDPVLETKNAVGKSSHALIQCQYCSKQLQGRSIQAHEALCKQLVKEPSNKESDRTMISSRPRELDSD